MAKNKDSKKPLDAVVSESTNGQRQKNGSVKTDGKQQKAYEEYDDLKLGNLEKQKKLLENKELEQKIAIREKVTNSVEKSIKYMFRTLIAGIGIFAVSYLIIFFLGANDALKTFITNSNAVGYFIALVVAPITSITAINVALLYGAFRKSSDGEKGKDSDVGESIIKNAPKAANAMQSDSSGMVNGN